MATRRASKLSDRASFRRLVDKTITGVDRSTYTFVTRETRFIHSHFIRCPFQSDGISVQFGALLLRQTGSNGWSGCALLRWVLWR